MLGPRRIELRELAVPEAPPPGGAIAAVLANGICGSDWDVYSGRMKNPAGRPAPFPMVPGHEPVVRIERIDPAAAAAWGVGEGDRVVVESRVRCGQCKQCLAGQGPACSNSVTYSLVPLDEGSGLHGGMAERMVLRAGSSVFRVPDGLSDEDAALSNPLSNAMQWTIEAGRVRVGDRVLVLGCGQRGLCCAVAAKEAGAAQVIMTGTRRDAHKLALAPSLGVDRIVVVEDADTVEAVHDATDGELADVAIDTVPESHAPIADAFEALRVGGRLVVAGVRGGTAADFPFDRIRSRQLTVVGVAATTAWSTREALRLLASGRWPFARLHTHRVGLEGAEDAIRTLGGEVGDGAIHITIVPGLRAA